MKTRCFAMTPRTLPLRLSFRGPRPAPVVIFYEHDAWIKKLILRDIPSTTLEVFPTNLYLTPAIMLRTLLRLRRIPWRTLRGPNRVKELFRQAFAQYLLACIDQTKAAVVLTIVDNSALFHRLSQLDRERAYFAIQNGARTLACVRDSLPPPPHPASVIRMTDFFCFGQRDIDLFTRHGHRIERYHPVGSLIGGYYKSRISAASGEPRFDLCLISQWHEHFFGRIQGDGFPAQTARRFGAGIKALNAFLLRLVQETGLRLAVCPRDSCDAGERSFYEEAFGDLAVIVESARENFSTYRTIEQSRLALAVNSTTLSEIFAWGQKTLWCNIPEDEHLQMPEAGISYFHGADYAAFKERILILLGMPQEEYRRRTESNARYINSFDPSRPPHELIRSAILKALSDDASAQPQRPR